MRPFRSLLFVPGHKPTWVEKAMRSGADAVILDLEDAVPPAGKNDARQAVAESITWLRDKPIGVLVRPNSWDSDEFAADLAAVVRPGLGGLLLPKVMSGPDVLRFDGALTAAELAAGVPRGSVELVLMLETAASIARCDEIVTASPRVAGAVAAAAKGGDAARDIGFEWTPAGLETLYLRSRTVIACRANQRVPFVGLWQAIDDLDGLAAFAAQNRQLGFRGQVLIHPSHVDTVNRAYSPTSEEIEHARRVIEEFEDAISQGNAAARVDGEMIDEAHAASAREILHWAKEAEQS